MTVYLAVSQSASGLDIRPVTAADRDAAAQQIKATLAQGLSVNAGVREAIQIALVEIAAWGTITPTADGQAAAINYSNQQQAAIADLPAFTVSSVATANTAVQAIRTEINSLLAELRAAGVIST